jgi:2-oxoglutarate ferredoxin oxidoreductase subunit alpha
LKWETAKTVVPDAVISKADQSTRLGIIAYGSSDGAVIEARDLLEEQGIHANYLRIRAFPFTREVMGFLRDHDTVFVVEQNRDAQMKSLLMLEYNDIADRMVSILHYNGMPISSECVVQGVSEHVKSEAAA